MDAVKELFQINFSYILISVFIVLIGVRTIASPLNGSSASLGWRQNGYGNGGKNTTCF